MQVQLIVANEQRNGQVIPVNVPSFMIGRAEGCNLRSRSQQVSRFHCTIVVNNNVVSIQDLGGENGTYVNGNRVSATQTLKDGDKLVVGTHSFVVSIKAGTPTVSESDFFELTPSSMAPEKSEQNDTAHTTAIKKTAIIKDSKPEAEVMFDIRLNGQRVSVSKNKLFELARKGSVLPDDLVTVAGTKVFADSIQGIVFGDKSSAPPTPPPAPAPPASGVRKPAPLSAPPAPAADPLQFPDLGETAQEESPFDHIASEPFVRIARKESAFSALWNALDISFSRVYAIEGNHLVVHSIKALYYVVVVTCFLGIFWTSFSFFKDWYETGEVLVQLQKHAVGLSVVTFGCVTIIVIVRVLLEMLLLAWFESAKAERENETKNNNGNGEK